MAALPLSAIVSPIYDILTNQTSSTFHVPKMVLRHLYRLLVKLKPKSRSKSKSKPISQPAAQPGDSTEIQRPGTLSYILLRSTADTREAESTSTPTQVADEPTQESHDVARTSLTQEHNNPPQQASPIPPDTRRYGQIFEKSDPDPDTRSSFELVEPGTKPPSSTTTLCPPLPPFRERKRSCGGA